MAHIRMAVPGEEELLRSLRIQALTDKPDAFGSTVAREHNRSSENLRGWMTNGVVYMLLARGKARGLVAGVPVDDDERGVYLVSMWIHTKLRGKGHGDALVEAIKKWAQARGADHVLLDVGAHNEHARRLYERCGFVATGHKKPGTHPGVVEVEMRWEPSAPRGRKSS